MDKKRGTKIFLTLFAIQLSFLCSQYSYSLPNPKWKESIQFLYDQDVIKIILEDSPGHGHLAANLSLISQFRDLGYKGEIQLFYLEESFQKLSILYDGFDPDEKGVFVDFTNNVRFFPMKDGQTSAPSLFVIAGASDVHYYPNSFNAKYFLWMSPMAWQTGNVIEDNRGNQVNMRHHIYAPYYYRAESPKDLRLFIKTHTHSNVQILQGLQALAENWERFESYLGYHYRSAIVDRTPYSDYQRVLTILHGIRWAQEHGKHHFRGPVVIPVMNNLAPQEFLKLNLLMQEFEKLFAIDIRSPDFKQALMEIEGNDILLIFIGPVAQPLFHYLLSQTTLPPRLYGANATNYMISNGKPFIPTVLNLPILLTHPPFIRSVLKKESQKERIVNEIFDITNTDPGFLSRRTSSDKYTKLVGRFINKAKLKNSNTSKLFRQISPRTPRSEGKLYLYLKELSMIEFEHGGIQFGKSSVLDCSGLLQFPPKPND